MKPEKVSTLKRLRNRYRLVIMNDDTYEEVVTFKLSRLSVYVTLSTIFVVLVGLTVALIVFTPLKYYIPGYEDFGQQRQNREMKYTVDSLNNVVKNQTQFIEGLQKLLRGDMNQVLDTTLIEVPKDEFDN